MSDSTQNTSVNQHYLNKVIDLSEDMRVEASEDIFDARGNKLLAKGAQVSRALQERLIVHKLRKPLESCIFVEDGIDSSALRAAAERVSATPALGHILASTCAGNTSPIATVAQLRVGSALSMMLTIADRGGDAALDHAVTVSLLSIAISAKAGLSAAEQTVAGLAGLLHDIGELYIDPTYLVKGKRLLPHEWAHIVVHPHTGMMLINQLESFPTGVGRAVAEHHERNDGSGYPRRLAGDAISPVGHVVSIAETVAGVIVKDHALERAALALKIVPGEYARHYTSALTGALRGRAASSDPNSAPEYGVGPENAARLVQRIGAALDASMVALNSPAPKSARSKEILAATVRRIQQVQRAGISTGLDMPLELDSTVFSREDFALMFEREVSSREIQWRLRDIARDLALQGLQGEDRLLFAPLIQLLDDDHSAHSPASGSLHAAPRSLAQISAPV